MTTVTCMCLVHLARRIVIAALEAEPTFASLGVEQQQFSNPLFEEGQGAEPVAVSGMLSPL